MVTILGLAAFVVVYIVILNHEERVMEDYYKDLRETDPALYLSEIRQARGFDYFLTEYLRMNDYETPKAEVPPFLMGRWALFGEEKRVGDDFMPESCLNSLEIEDARLKLLEDGEERLFPVRYTMDGNRASAHLEQGQAAHIAVVAYGSHVHHVEVDGLPVAGQNPSTTWYGYLCH